MRILQARVKIGNTRHRSCHYISLWPLTFDSIGGRTKWCSTVGTTQANHCRYFKAPHTITYNNNSYLIRLLSILHRLHFFFMLYKKKKWDFIAIRHRIIKAVQVIVMRYHFKYDYQAYMIYFSRIESTFNLFVSCTVILQKILLVKYKIKKYTRKNNPA